MNNIQNIEAQVIDIVQEATAEVEAMIAFAQASKADAGDKSGFALNEAHIGIYINSIQQKLHTYLVKVYNESK